MFSQPKPTPPTTPSPPVGRGQGVRLQKTTTMDNNITIAKVPFGKSQLFEIQKDGQTLPNEQYQEERNEELAAIKLQYWDGHIRPSQKMINDFLTRIKKYK